MADQKPTTDNNFGTSKSHTALLLRFHQKRFTLLMISVLMLLLAVPAVENLPDDQTFLRLVNIYAIPTFFTLIMMLAVHALLRNRRMFILAVITGVFALPAQWLSVIFDDQWLAVIRLIMIIAFLLLVAGSILWAVVTSPRVDTDTLSGAVCVYLLMGLIGGCLYTLIQGLSPFSIQYAATAVDQNSIPLTFIGHPANTLFSELLYFSFVTMTTLGYGDIVPVSMTAKTLAYLQAITGQFYIAVLVARLVGMHLANGVIRHDNQ